MNVRMAVLTGIVTLTVAAPASAAAAAPALHRPPPRTVTVTTCHTDAAGARVCIERRLRVHWVQLGVPAVRFSGGAATVTLRRSGGHIAYTVDGGSATDGLRAGLLIRAHTVAKQYRLRLGYGWRRITRRTAVMWVNVAGVQNGPVGSGQPFQPA